MARLNTVHITVLEARGLPPAAAYLTAQCSGQKVKLANLDKGRGRGADEASMIQRNGAAICWHFPLSPHTWTEGGGGLWGVTNSFWIFLLHITFQHIPFMVLFL